MSQTVSWYRFMNYFLSLFFSSFFLLLPWHKWRFLQRWLSHGHSTPLHLSFIIHSFVYSHYTPFVISPLSLPPTAPSSSPPASLFPSTLTLLFPLFLTNFLYLIGFVITFRWHAIIYNSLLRLLYSWSFHCGLLLVKIEIVNIASPQSLFSPSWLSSLLQIDINFECFPSLGRANRIFRVIKICTW